MHFQLPRSSETYVHRSGRTARAQASGLSVSLVEPSEQRSYRKLCHELGEADGLPELELDLRQISRHREIAVLALALDRVAHKEQRENANKARHQKRTALVLALALALALVLAIALAIAIAIALTPLRRGVRSSPRRWTCLPTPRMRSMRRTRSSRSRRAGSRRS